MESINNLKSKIKGESRKNISSIDGDVILKVIGIIALALPATLIVGAPLIGDCTWIQGSISAYYHTVMRDVFVGALWAVGFSMLAYKGYHRLDGKFATAAGILAISVSIFPTGIENPDMNCIMGSIEYQNAAYNTIHFISAALLFIVLAIFCLFFFTMSDSNKRLFKSCGYTILSCIALIVIYKFFFSNGDYPKIDGLRPVFFLETFALLAFGISWFAKSLNP